MLELVTLRRLAVPDLRPRRRRAICGSGIRYAVRGRKLTSEQDARIRALAHMKSLRSLAAVFAVSHETIRGVIRQATGESLSV